MSADWTRHAPANAALAALAQQSVAAWAQLMEGVAEAQMRVLEETLATPGNEELEELVRRWTDAQREALVGWLALAEQAGPATNLDELRAAGTAMTDSLREAAERLVHSQGEWAKAWTDAHGDHERGGPDNGG